MKGLYLSLLIILCFLISGHLEAQTKGILHLIDSNYAVINYSRSEFACFENAKPTTLSEREIRQIENLANESISEYNNRITWWRIDKKYKAQIVAVINKKGEKEVWVNCFCGDGWEGWKQHILSVRDGGTCFFNLKINLSLGKCYNLMVNGEA